MPSTTVAILSAAEDAAFVARLVGDLQARGFAVDDIAGARLHEDPGTETAALHARLEDATAVLVVLSPAAIAAAQLRGEMEFALLAGLAPRMIALVVAPVTVPYDLRANAPVLFSAGTYADALAQLVPRLDALVTAAAEWDVVLPADVAPALPYPFEEPPLDGERQAEPPADRGGPDAHPPDAGQAASDLAHRSLPPQPDERAWEPERAPITGAGTRQPTPAAPVPSAPPDTRSRPPIEPPPPAPQPRAHYPGVAYLPPDTVYEPAPAAPAPIAPAPTAPAPTAPAEAEEVAFISYAPREVALQHWERLLIYLSLDGTAARALVHADALERLAGRSEAFRASTAPATTFLPRGTRLTLVPDIPGFSVNPPVLSVIWQEDAQAHEFRVRAETAPAGQAVNGSVAVFTGLLLRAEIPISIFVRQAGMGTRDPSDCASAIARAYRRIFASYSHKDEPIVRSCEQTARATGDQYLRDVILLRSGQQWDPQLLRAITEADIFQLFWSKAAATSPAVEREWRHALSLAPARGNFIRPVYWTAQPYPVPAELNGIHFARMEARYLGIKVGRPLWRALFARG